MTNQRILTQNIRQVLLGVSSQQGVVSTIRKKRSLSPLLTLTIVICITLVTTFLVTPLISIHDSQVQVSSAENNTLVEQKKSLPPPIRLRIQRINVDAIIEPVGLTIDGAMDTPKEAANAGWFSIGPHPGEMGSVVITGHLDAEDGATGVFHDLYVLTAGDQITVTDSSGVSRSFVVLESREYDWDEDVPEIFYNTNGQYLNLITCVGSWNNAQKKYEKRLVVFTKLQL